MTINERFNTFYDKHPTAVHIAGMLGAALAVALTDSKIGRNRAYRDLAKAQTENLCLERQDMADQRHRNRIYWDRMEMEELEAMEREVTAEREASK